jgi:hypothetical protein
MSFRFEVFKAKQEPRKLLMYSFSPDDLLKEVFVMKHLKSKCEVIGELSETEAKGEASWFNISSSSE